MRCRVLSAYCGQGIEALLYAQHGTGLPKARRNTDRIGKYFCEPKKSSCLEAGQRVKQNRTCHSAQAYCLFTALVASANAENNAMVKRTAQEAIA